MPERHILQVPPCNASTLKPARGGLMPLLLIAFAGGVAALTPALASPERCAALQGLALPEARVLQAQYLAAGRFAPPQGAAFNLTKPACRVEISAAPTPASDIRIEVWLPDAALWNGRFWGLGNGSFGGQIPHRGLAVRSAAGYAAVATDTGHQADPSDARWALGHPEKVVDYGHRSVHLAAVLGKRATEAYFGRPPAHAYFSAYSNGGRQALMLAQRYPEDYDGIMAGAAAPDLTGLYSGAAEFLARHSMSPEARLSAAQVDVLAAAVRASCDSQDGVRDGVIENSSRCRFDPASLSCQAWTGKACLSTAQVAGVRQLYGGVPLHDLGPAGTAARPPARAPAPGLAPGSEGPWHALLFGDQPGGAGLHDPVESFFRYLVVGNAAWEMSSFRLQREGRLAQDRLSEHLDAVNPDISRFVARGGKLLMWHGWNDVVVSPGYSLVYHASVLRRLGPKSADSAVRLFMAPGVEHGIGGPGPDRFGQFAGGDGDPERSLGAALRRWVEQGVAPERVITVRHRIPGDVASGVARSRPLCAYPRVAVYGGSGSTDEAQNFRCGELTR